MNIDKQQAVKRLDAIEEEAKQLRSIIEAAEPKPRTGMILDINDIEVGNKYWIRTYGDMGARVCTGIPLDKRIIETGLAFYDKESAELSQKRVKLKVVAKKAERDAWLAHGDELRWGDDSHAKYCALWNWQDDKIFYEDCDIIIQISDYNFPTKSSCKAFFDSLSKEDAKLLLTGRV